MKRIISKILIALIVITFLTTYVVVFADEKKDSTTKKTEEVEEDEEETSITDELESKKDDLEDAITDSEAQMGIVEDELTESLAEVAELSMQISQQEEQITNLESQELSLNSYIEETEDLLQEVTENYDSQKELVEARLVAMYETSKTTYLDILVGSNDLTDFLSKYYLIAEITESDLSVINLYEDTKTEMESINESLKEKKEELNETKDDLEKYKVSLSNMQILMNTKVNDLNEEEEKIYNDIETYRQEIDSLEAEIRFLALQEVSDTYIGGDFIWPTPGYTTITSQFGMRTHPITGVYKLHTGVDIGAPYGSTFVAAADGVVVSAYYNSAYGNMVMIDHGGGIMTLYAHGSEILVEEGQAVTAGEAVLKVGSTGYSTGPHAHFEIRINGEYVNPLDYVTPFDTTEAKEMFEKLEEQEDDE